MLSQAHSLRAQVAHNYARQDQLFHRVLHLPVALGAVSEAVQAILARQFGRSSLLIPNGVDCDRFFPGPPSDALPSAILSSPTKAQVCHSTLVYLVRVSTGPAQVPSQLRCMLREGHACTP